MAKKVNPPNADQKTLELIQEVKRRKEEISKLEKPNWQTNMIFPVNEGKPETINLRVESDVKALILIASQLKSKFQAYNETANLLKVNAPKFTWGGFSVEEWFSDIKTRIDKIQIAEKKKTLENYEIRLKSIISPELQRQMELEDIENQLN